MVDDHIARSFHAPCDGQRVPPCTLLDRQGQVARRERVADEAGLWRLSHGRVLGAGRQSLADERTPDEEQRALRREGICPRLGARQQSGSEPDAPYH